MVFALAVGACGAAVTPRGDAGDSGVAVSDASLFCPLPGGGRCPAGTTCPAGDGCNTCSCPASGGNASCTLIGCVSDAGPTTGCSSSAQCANGQECVFGTSSCGQNGTCMPTESCFDPETYCSCTGVTYQACRPTRPTALVGRCDSPTQRCNERTSCLATQECIYTVGACGVDGRCAPISDCAATADFCGCDGSSFRACPGRPTRPAASETRCTGSVDGGVADSGFACVGARLNAAGACERPSGAAPVECCTGYNCDQSSALCERLPPVCPSGFVPSIVGACYGPCVPSASCRR
ncbi:MAG: hypothetical protein JNK05_37810 [Myxococcales bacterium]|nr:hypothetical protein [Myxococcales bacterium]